MSPFTELLQILTKDIPIVGQLPAAVYMILPALLILFLLVLPFAGLATYIERKIAGDIQSRIGPNVVGPYGILQWIADAIKLLFKEDIIPAIADKNLFVLAPIVVFVGSFATFVVIPFAKPIIVSDLNIGIFYIIAISSLGALGIIMGGWASNNKYSLLGGLRSAAQVVSYEIPVALSLLPPILIAGSLKMGDFVSYQSYWNWILFHNPFTILAFFSYFVAAIAEVNRTPFDIPEAESELVSGYNTEYSGMRFAIFFLAEYANAFIICAICTALFLGGWNLPLLDISSLSAGIQVPLQLLSFMGKCIALILIIMWLRWTLPRYRVDQLMTLCWKILTPLAFINIFGTAVWMLIFKGKGIPELIKGFFG